MLLPPRANSTLSARTIPVRVIAFLTHQLLVMPQPSIFIMLLCQSGETWPKHPSPFTPTNLHSIRVALCRCIPSWLHWLSVTLAQIVCISWTYRTVQLLHVLPLVPALLDMALQSA